MRFRGQLWAGQGAGYGRRVAMAAGEFLEESLRVRVIEVRIRMAASCQ